MSFIAWRINRAADEYARPGSLTAIKNLLRVRRLRIPGIATIYDVDDPAEVVALASDPCIDRKFVLRTCLLNWLLLKRSLTVLSFNGHRLPTVTGRDSQERQIHQQALAKILHERAASIRLGPEELDLGGILRLPPKQQLE